MNGNTKTGRRLLYLELEERAERGFRKRWAFLPLIPLLPDVRNLKTLSHGNAGLKQLCPAPAFSGGLESARL